MGLDFDGSGAGLATRCKRFSLTANDGVVETLEVEESPGDLSVSSADSCLASLG
jgi:peroxiredoxin